MKRLWARWLQFLEIREPAEALALCRILAGIGLMASVSFAWHHETWRMLWLDVAQGGYRTLDGGPWLIRLLGGPRPEVVGPVLGLTFFCGAGLAAGFHSRWSAGVGLLLFNSLIRINPHDGSAYDSLLTNQLFLLIWADAGAVLSVDGWLRRRKGAVPTEIFAWPRHVMIFQLVICYASTGLQKLGADWLPGGDLEAVHYILQDPFWRRWDLDRWLPGVHGLTRLATAFTWWFEVLAPLLLVSLWFRATAERGGWLRTWSNRIDYRLWFAVAGIALHLGLHLLMRIGPFSWIILSYYPALWSGREVQRGIERCWKGSRA
jgi:hypothetical protein